MTALKEAWNNFTQSVFFNIILILQLAVCSWLFILLCNNFLDMGYNDGWKKDFTVKDEVYYTTVSNIALDNSLSSFRLQQDFIADLRSQSLFSYMKIDGNLFTYAREDFWAEADIEQKLTQNGGTSNPDGILFGSLQTNSNGEAGSASATDGVQFHKGETILEERDGVTWRQIKSTQMDYNAFQKFPLQYIQGGGFQKEDFLLREGQNVVPIILGYNYNGIFEVGDILPMQLDNLTFQGKVVGILAKNSYTFYNGEQLRLDQILLLDNDILWPYFDLEEIIGTDNWEAEPPEIQNRILFQSNLIKNLTGAYIVTSKDVSNIALSKLYNEICERHDVLRFGPEISTKTVGMMMLAGETEESVTILLVLVCVMAFFSLFILITSMLTKIDRNLRTYMIQMINGASIWNIIAQYILEILMISVPAGIITALLMYKQIYYHITFLVVLIILSLVSAVLSSVIVAVKLGNLKTDELLRRKE